MNYLRKAKELKKKFHELYCWKCGRSVGDHAFDGKCWTDENYRFRIYKKDSAKLIKGVKDLIEQMGSGHELFNNMGDDKILKDYNEAESICEEIISHFNGSASK